MAEINLNDVRGFWRDLVGPAYMEFWFEYKSDRPLTQEAFSVIYRRLLSVAVLINHQADKAAFRHGFENGRQLINRIEELDSCSGAALRACRHLVNDVKHDAKLLQVASERERRQDFDPEGVNPMLLITLKLKGGETYDICDSVIKAFSFWCGYFDGSSKVSYQQGTFAV